jgi:hypothetical protein
MSLRHFIRILPALCVLAVFVASATPAAALTANGIDDIPGCEKPTPYSNGMGDEINYADDFDCFKLYVSSGNNTLHFNVRGGLNVRCVLLLPPDWTLLASALAAPPAKPDCSLIYNQSSLVGRLYVVRVSGYNGYYDNTRSYTTEFTN